MSLGDRDYLFFFFLIRAQFLIGDGSITYTSAKPPAPGCDCSSPQLQNFRQGAQQKFGNGPIITLKYALGVPMETWLGSLEKQTLGSGEQNFS